MAIYEIETESGAVYQIETAGADDAPPTPSLMSDPIDALTSKDWWLTRPSGERISAAQAVVGPTSRALDALTFGLGDEIVAGGSSIFEPGTYDEKLDRVRGYQNSFKKASPVVDTGLQIAGAIKMPFGTSLKSTDGIIKGAGKLAAEGAG